MKLLYCVHIGCKLLDMRYCRDKYDKEVKARKETSVKLKHQSEKPKRPGRQLYQMRFKGPTGAVDDNGPVNEGKWQPVSARAVVMLFSITNPSIDLSP